MPCNLRIVQSKSKPDIGLYRLLARFGILTGIETYNSSEPQGVGSALVRQLQGGQADGGADFCASCAA